MQTAYKQKFEPINSAQNYVFLVLCSYTSSYSPVSAIVIHTNSVISMDKHSCQASLLASLQDVKRSSGKTYNQIAAETGLTNVYVAQLLKRQAQLKPDTVPKLREALPCLVDHQIQEMMLPPMRSYDPNLIQEPTVYRSPFSSIL